MCLSINKNVKLPKVQKDGYCIGYKVVYHHDTSIYQCHKYVLGINKSNRRQKPLYLFETNREEVHQGFHIFLRLRTAKKMLVNRTGCRKIIKVFFKPENVVALGTWENSHNVVVTKLLVKSLNNICKEE